MNDNNIMFLPPGISEEFAEHSGWGFGYVTAETVKELMKPRRQDAHKGTYGHALLICGSKGMAGAAVLSTGAALRSGCGLVTVHLPESERFAVEANFPSALYSLDSDEFFTSMPSGMEKYSVVGIGCGLGQHSRSMEALQDVLVWCRDRGIKMVIDADALNLLAADRSLQRFIPPGAVLTPHIGELKRLVGEWRGEQEKIELVAEFASRLRCVMVVKGPNTAICNAGESVVFNSTGNSGMAKGGSGDVLTGFITGLAARGYEPYDAAVLGVFVHGSAGDKAAEYFGAEGMNSADLIDFLPEALKEIE